MAEPSQKDVDVPLSAEDASVFAWQTHAAIQSWTAAVDTKASIVLVVETAVAAAGANALVSSGGELHASAGLHLSVSAAALTCLIAAVVCALWVVFPRLNSRALEAQGLIYFGHLAQQSGEQVAGSLNTLTRAREQSELASQLAVTSRIAWRKHRWLQRSIVLLTLGATLLLLSFVAF